MISFIHFSLVIKQQGSHIKSNQIQGMQQQIVHNTSQSGCTSYSSIKSIGLISLVHKNNNTISNFQYYNLDFK